MSNDSGYHYDSSDNDEFSGSSFSDNAYDINLW